MDHQPKRRRVAEKDEHKGTQAIATENVHLKGTVDNMVDQMLCRLTGILPTEPVLAEDCHLYNRKAIEEWFGHQSVWNGTYPSPMTGDEMGTRLLPAVHVYNTAKMLVETGAVVGKKASEWQMLIEDEQKLEACRQKAELGDADAMLEMGYAHRYGSDYVGHGKVQVEINYKTAFEWFKKAAKKGNIAALAECGLGYMKGNGVEEKAMQGSMMLGQAAEKGSELACYSLGRTYQFGDYGFERNAQEAVEWFTKMQRCSVKDAGDIERERANEFLKEMDQKAN